MVEDVEFYIKYFKSEVGGVLYNVENTLYYCKRDKRPIPDYLKDDMKKELEDRLDEIPDTIKDNPKFRKAFMEELIPGARKYANCFNDKDEIIKLVKYYPASMAMKLGETEGHIFETISISDLTDIAEAEPRVLEYISKEKLAEVLVSAIQRGMGSNIVNYIQANPNLQFYEDTTRADKESKLTALIKKKATIEAEIADLSSELGENYKGDN